MDVGGGSRRTGGGLLSPAILILLVGCAGPTHGDRPPSMERAPDAPPTPVLAPPPPAPNSAAGARPVPSQPDIKPLPGNAGTGFFISARGDFVTAHHVIGGCASPALKTPDGLLEARPVTGSTTEDLSLIRTLKPPRVYARFAADPRQALINPVTIIRYRGGQGLASFDTTPAVFRGRYQNRDGGLVFEAAEPIEGGNSGSPVVARNGGVVGLILARAKEAPRITIATSAFNIAQFVAGAGVEIETITDQTTRPRAGRGVPMPGPTDFTFPVICLDKKRTATAGPPARS